MLIMNIEDEKVTWSCRNHPTDWFHEIGCPDKEWTKEELKQALEIKKKVISYLQKKIIEKETAKNANNN